MMLVSADEWRSLQETIFWLSQRRTADDLAESEHDIETGEVHDEDQVRAALNLPPR